MIFQDPSTFPGGKIEPQETGLQALKRELHEEIGILILSAELWMETNHSYPDYDVTLQIWKVTAYTGDAFGKEGQLIHWASLDCLNNYQFLAGNQDIINKLCSDL